jgi:hypothetical protein
VTALPLTVLVEEFEIQCGFDPAGGNWGLMSDFWRFDGLNDSGKADYSAFVAHLRPSVGFKRGYTSASQPIGQFSTKRQNNK